MRENVGRIDQALRSALGTALITIGYKFWGGRRKRLRGLFAIVGGALLLESAITRVCPLNHLLGIDSRKLDSKILPQRWQKALPGGERTEAVGQPIYYGTTATPPI